MSEAAPPSDRIAIVGRAGRFPAASSVAQYWSMLEGERVATTHLSDEELLARGVTRAKLADPNYVKAANILPDMECFDAGFWGFSPKDAAILDPQHRHFLECAWEAFEDAGHMPEDFEGRIGVFAGSGMQAYMPYNLLSNPELVQEIGLFLLRHTGNDKDFMPTRLSYLLDLQGPSVAVQTACSTSLVAAHQAINSLLAMECDMAIAGGVTVELPHHVGYTYAPNEILSPDGLCRAFDDDSQGTVFGSGAALVVLRRYEDAVEDGDDIKAVILASAINNDGAQKANYLAPSVEGQAEAVGEAVAVAGIEPSSISYIEAHGTGTNLGDPIELSALNEIYGEAAPGSIGIGSVKTNIGHLDTAAGAASLIKVVEAMRHKTLPASLNFKTPNKGFDFANSPFQVVDSTRDWAKGPTPRRAAINSLGVGGTNAHMVVEEAPERGPADNSECWRIFPFSAKSKPALKGIPAQWEGFLGDGAPALSDIAFTLRKGRRQFAERMVVAAKTSDDLSDAFSGDADLMMLSGTASDTPPEIVFLFPGGGAQYPGAGRDLLDQSPAFAAAVKECFAHLPSNAPDDLYACMFEADTSNKDAREKLGRSAYAIPALFILEYAYAKLWESWGVKPAAILAHSVGEYAGAVIAGAMSMQDAMHVVTLRGQVMDAAPKGAMTSIPAPEDKVAELIGDGLDIAAVNAPGLSVVSGPVEAIEALEAKLKDTEMEANRIHIDVAAHSRVLDGQLEPFRAGFSDVTFGAATIPFVSSMRGTWGNGGDFASADYWVEHLRNTVRFTQAVSEVLKTPNRIILEVGPGRTLGPLVDMAEAEHKPAAILYSGRKPRDEADDMGVALTALGGLWANGAEINWDALEGATGRRVSLPTYAFEKQRHWIEPGTHAAGEAVADDHVAITRIPELENWFTRYGWTETPLRAGVNGGALGPWLVFASDDPISAATLDALSVDAIDTIIVTQGTAFSQTETGYTIRPDAVEDYEALLDALPDIPAHILHLWPTAHEAQTHIFDSAFALMRSLQTRDLGSKTTLGFATTGLADIAGSGVARPAASTLLGPVRVGPREIPNLRTLLISADVSATPDETARALLDEFSGGDAHDYIAWKDGTRYAETRSALATTPAQALPTRVKTGGTYLITGGMGGIGQELAAYLASTAQARIAILSRSAKPQPELERQIKGAGGEVMFVSADVTDLEGLQAAIGTVRDAWGEISGLFHAAGLIEDAPLSMKTLDEARAIMAPKVTGADNLAAIFEPGSLDIFGVFSSSSVVLGTPGQTDYVAANAYLEALAASRSDGLAIAWGIWRDIGMAAETYGTKLAKGDVHPLLGPVEIRDGNEQVFVAGINAAEEWVLADHVVGGALVLPGMAYLDLAYTAARHVAGHAKFEIRALSLLAPMIFDADLPRQVIVRLKPVHDGYEFTVESAQGAAAPEMEHARAHIVIVRKPKADLPAGLDVDTSKYELSDSSFKAAQQGVIDFGPRWNTIGEIRAGRQAVEGQFKLPEEFLSDLETYPIHPGVMDHAATVGLHLLSDIGQDGKVYAPISIERTRILAPLGADVISKAVLVSGGAGGFASFDVVISDLMGNVLVILEGLAMKSFEGGLTPGVGAEKLTDMMLAGGISAADAPAIFARALQSDAQRMIVSSIALDTVRAAMVTERKIKPKRDPDAAPATEGNPVERWLGGVWSDLLGLDTVSPDDDFFAMGGHSLNAVRMFGQIRKKYDVDLPLATLFEAPTLKAIAAQIVVKGNIDIGEVAPGEEIEIAAWSPLVQIKKGDGNTPPLYCIHGAGGNVLNFRSLSGYLDNAISFFGVRALGSDGGLEIDETIEAMAERYMAAILEYQPVGPYRLAGYSGGGVVAYEIAQRLKATGEEVEHLIFFDTLAPDVAKKQMTFLQKLWAARKWDLQFALEWWARKKAAGQGKDSMRQIDELLAKGETLPDELVGVRMTKAYLTSQALYEAKPYDGDVLIFRARRASTEFLSAGADLGWERFVKGQIDTRTFNCDHFSMMSDPAIGEIGDVLNGVFRKG